jgi:hypothetical protein
LVGDSLVNGSHRNPAAIRKSVCEGVECDAPLTVIIPHNYYKSYPTAPYFIAYVPLPVEFLSHELLNSYTYDTVEEMHSGKESVEPEVISGFQEVGRP